MNSVLFQKNRFRLSGQSKKQFNRIIYKTKVGDKDNDLDYCFYFDTEQILDLLETLFKLIFFIIGRPPVVYATVYQKKKKKMYVFWQFIFTFLKWKKSEITLLIFIILFE